MNSRLLASYVKEEIEIAIKHMFSTKSAGPDGFPTLFYQKYWNIVGYKIVQAGLNVLNNDIRGLNNTYIALIPKVKAPQLVSNYRPISLCNLL